MSGALSRGILLATLALGITGPGCVDKGTQDIVVKRALLFDANCVPDLNAVGSLAAGAFDIKNTSYVLSLEVNNNVVAEFTPEGREVIGRHLFLYEGTDVTLTSDDEAFNNIDVKLRQYVVPGFGTINPSTGVGGNASKLAATISLFPPALLQDATFRSLAARQGGFRVFASMEVFGTMDDSSLSANTVKFPIDVCEGCLLRTLGMCDQFNTMFKFAGSSCFPGQDQITECCTSPTGVAICPGKGTMQ